MTRQVDVAIIGAGSWGTALAHHLARSGSSVSLWGRDKEVLAAIEEKKENPKYFPGEKLHPSIQTSETLELALSDASLVVFSVPSSAMRSIAECTKKLIADDAIVVAVTFSS